MNERPQNTHEKSLSCGDVVTSSPWSLDIGDSGSTIDVRD